MDDWDSILDPYQDSLQQGRLEGEQAGIRSGYNDGWDLGKIKGLEIGIELGYMYSVASEALLNLSRIPSNGEEVASDVQTIRRVKKIRDFIGSIQSFPIADEIFSEPVDIAAQMQIIRARFKTILVQMKMSHLALKKVMNGEIPENGDERGLKNDRAIERGRGINGKPETSTQEQLYQDNEW